MPYDWPSLRTALELNKELFLFASPWSPPGWMKASGTMLGGSVVVESVFSLPGLGRLAYESVVQRDLNTLLGIVFVSALLVITVNFAVDLLYARLDPRIVAEG